jgi:hypothetical protein
MTLIAMTKRTRCRAAATAAILAVVSLGIAPGIAYAQHRGGGGFGGGGGFRGGGFGGGGFHGGGFRGGGFRGGGWGWRGGGWGWGWGWPVAAGLFAGAALASYPYYGYGYGYGYPYDYGYGGYGYGGYPSAYSSPARYYAPYSGAQYGQPNQNYGIPGGNQPSASSHPPY